MKLIFRYKGGPGSGFHGHSGRPGKVGGSTSGGGHSIAANDYRRVELAKIDAATLDYVKGYIDKIVSKVNTDEKFRNAMVGLMADGEHFSTASLTMAIDETLINADKPWIEGDVIDVIIEDNHPGFLDDLEDAYSKAVAEDGYLAPPFTGERLDRLEAVAEASNRMLDKYLNAYLDENDPKYAAIQEEEANLVELLTGTPGVLSPARKAWERKYYGRVVGGYMRGQDYGYRQLAKLLK